MVSSELNKPYGGAGIWHHKFESKDPIKCIKHAVKLSEQVVAGLVEVIEHNNKLLNNK